MFAIFSTVTRGNRLGEAVTWVVVPCCTTVITPSTGGGGGGVGDLGGGEKVSLSLRMASSDTWDRIPPVSDSMLESNSWGVAVPVSA